MRVLIYEFMTGGGAWSWSDELPEGPLLSEGRAMLQAVAADFAQVPEVDLTVFCDARLALDLPAGCRIVKTGRHQELDLLEHHSAAADWSLIIAPETKGALLDRCRFVESAGGRLLGPGSKCVELTADKFHFNRYLAAQGIRVPDSRPIGKGQALPAEFRYPGVLKRRDGAGSEGIELRQRGGERDVVLFDSCLEAYCEGIDASISMLFGRGEVHLMPAGMQHVNREGAFQYFGGRIPLEGRLRMRAEQLARQVAVLLPVRCGYLGLDLVLGRAADGTADHAIEVNPRLTTSYLGLRQLTSENLAGAMLELACATERHDSFTPCGLATTPSVLSFSDEPVEFSASGCS